MTFEYYGIDVHNLYLIWSSKHSSEGGQNMTEDELEAIAERLFALGVEPWVLLRPPPGNEIVRLMPGPVAVSLVDRAGHFDPEDAHFLVHAPDDLRQLLAEVKQWRALAEDCILQQDAVMIRAKLVAKLSPDVLEGETFEEWLQKLVRRFG
jgi:hypothetical protein